MKDFQPERQEIREVPPENVVAMFETAYKLGKYPPNHKSPKTYCIPNPISGI
jgi:hypothetical protein